MFWSSKPYMLLGMSHLVAICEAMNNDQKEKFDIYDLNFSPKLYDKKKNLLNLAPLKNKAPKYLFLSIRGNFHNVFGLMENPVRLAVGDAARGMVPEQGDRTFVPEDLFRESMKAQLDQLSFGLLKLLADHFKRSKIIHIASPPPCGDEEHIRAYPGVFRPKMQYGISPPPLRRKIYDVHTKIYRDECARLGIGYLEAPAAAVDERGMMKREFWCMDPTHGNALYGALVLEQIMATIGAAS